MKAERRDRFPDRCPSCAAPLGGVLIRSTFLADEEVVEIMRGLMSLRTVRDLFRTWLPSHALPGVRGRRVGSLEFASAFEEHKRPCGRNESADLARPTCQFETVCRACGVVWGGFVAKFQLLTMADVTGACGGGIGADHVRSWINRGLLRAFKIKGVRGPLFDVNEFETDLAGLRRRTLRAPGQSGRRTTREEDRGTASN